MRFYKFRTLRLGSLTIEPVCTICHEFFSGWGVRFEDGRGDQHFLCWLKGLFQ